MSWLLDLLETYEHCNSAEIPGDAVLMPICHTTLNAHIEITIDEKGEFRRAEVITENQNTLIPCTESSGGRSGSKPTTHPLCDKLQYVAGDFVDQGGIVTSGFKSAPHVPHQDYIALLESWEMSEFSHWKITAIHTYVKRGSVVRDLVAAGVLPVDEKTGLPLHAWLTEGTPPRIFTAVPKGSSPLDAVIRWQVERLGEVETSTWNDSTLVAAWISFETSSENVPALCLVSGMQTRQASNSPARIRHGGDKAKLISSNDSSGFTFRGRFIFGDEAARVGFDVVQKAHNALRWLIARQGYRNGDQVFVAWNPSGEPIPDPLRDTATLFLDPDDTIQEFAVTDDPHAIGHVGQAFAIRLRNAIAGYSSKLTPSAKVIVIGLDSATPGRLAIAYYRHLKGTDFLARIEAWHSHAAWHQKYGKDHRFIGAPSPKDVAEAAYGSRLDEKLKKATVERLVPCIIDAARIPIDLIRCLVNRTANRVGLENWEFEKNLGIACAMFRAYSHSLGKDYEMVLEVANRSRDYLYGRLLAIAEHLESRALFLAGENRDTNAARQMHRFADRPFTTWQQIELSLGPYRSQLRSKRPGTLNHLDSAIDEVMDLFETDDFNTDAKLTGEFLLAYHCQRRALWNNNSASETEGKD